MCRIIWTGRLVLGWSNFRMEPTVESFVFRSAFDGPLLPTQPTAVGTPIEICEAFKERMAG